MFGVRVRECSNVWGLGVLQGCAPMFGVRVRGLQCLGLGSGSAPMFGVRVRECSNVWG